jgi:hypothetical protein
MQNGGKMANEKLDGLWAVRLSQRVAILIHSETLRVFAGASSISRSSWALALRLSVSKFLEFDWP